MDRRYVWAVTALVLSLSAYGVISQPPFLQLCAGLALVIQGFGSTRNR